MLEKDFQAKIIKWLKSKKCMVFKMQMNATTKAGTPDLMWCYKSSYGFIEVKRSSNAKFQPGQKEMIENLGKWTFAKVVFPENFDIVKEEIDKIIQHEDMQDKQM